METYHYKAEEALDQPMTVFGGLEDQIVNRDDLAAWQDVTKQTIDLHMMPGGHFFIQTAQPALLPVVARKLTAR
jgi:surfactin synthase thioesterase subunit